MFFKSKSAPILISIKGFEWGQIGPVPGASKPEERGYQPSKEMVDMWENARMKVEAAIERYEALVELGNRWNDPPVDKREPFSAR